MTYYDYIYEYAVDNHYLITTDNASQIGIPPIELAKLAYRGKLVNISRGLYRLSRWVPDDSYPYAEAVARMGHGAYLFGESVIALLGLAPTNPSAIYVAVPDRTRRKLPEGMRVMRAPIDDIVTTYEGVPSQHLSQAIPTAQRSMMPDRLRDAADKAREEGYLTPAEYTALYKEMGWEQAGQTASET